MPCGLQGGAGGGGGGLAHKKSGGDDEGSWRVFVPPEDLQPDAAGDQEGDSANHPAAEPSAALMTCSRDGIISILTLEKLSLVKVRGEGLVDDAIRAYT